MHTIAELKGSSLGIIHLQFRKRCSIGFSPDVTNAWHEVDRESGHPCRIDFVDDSDVSSCPRYLRYLALSIPNKQHRPLGKEETRHDSSHLLGSRPLGNSLARHVHH
jgi:hypothetical protein